MNASAQILLGLGLGLGGGILFSLTEPPLLSELPVWIAPIGELWINGIRMTVVPMLMALLITAVAGQPSSSAVANLSGKTLALLVALITGLSLTGNTLLVRSYQYGPASLIAPFIYLQLIWAALFGWLIFSAFPDGWSLAGMITIVAAGLLLVPRPTLRDKG